MTRNSRQLCPCPGFLFSALLYPPLLAPPSKCDPKFIHITRPVWMHVQFHHKFNLKYFFDCAQYVLASLVLLIPANRVGLSLAPILYMSSIRRSVKLKSKSEYFPFCLFYYDCNSIFLLIWYLFMGKHRWFSIVRGAYPYRTEGRDGRNIEGLSDILN